MFSVDGSEDFSKVFDTWGKFFKLVGVTDLASLGYGITPSSALAAEGAAVSAQAEGIDVGYLNDNFAFGSTNVAPVAIAMKDNGADGLFSGVETQTAFSLLTALQQSGVHLKAALLPIGYGGDLLSSGPSALQDAQGAYFVNAFEPAEMRTAATERFQRFLKQDAGVAEDPTTNEYFAYASVAAIVDGLKAAGAHPTQSSFIHAMSRIDDFDADGLFGSHTVSFGMAQRGKTMGADNCTWITRFSGSTFHLVPGADPICGSLIPGKTV